MTVINTNVNALQATNASNRAANMTSQAMTRLSTGTRINSAADDAAGLAISTSMTSQINGMNQGIKNANDGISLAQTAQGSLTEVTNMMQRVRELSVQSASGTYQDTDREDMQQEVNSLKTQITSILGDTKFNGNALFNTTGAGSAATTSFSIQAGANTTDTITLTSQGIDWDAQKANIDVTSSGSASATIDKMDTLIRQVSTAAASFGAGQSQLQAAVNNLTNNSTNLSAARSRIQDTDYSAESTAMAKAQILSQASTAMIAQANQSQQNVLSLLK
ncbi:flagellin N-terminal helical domain-containing protein [Novosphingobium sp. KACC 22771]|uniref:flagellin N-terminal helical domain-containing protein n=1 Tax=Novosphingobium sp. KACC 22771 TaxID=3025670 RepID=UPI0023672B51|nr:flagellin [Novosphingobium sp. KACC 22771]WDF73266.1 flagellin [Novosphingobium sp. KACC 22771]